MQSAGGRLSREPLMPLSTYSWGNRKASPFAELAQFPKLNFRILPVVQSANSRIQSNAGRCYPSSVDVRDHASTSPASFMPWASPQA
jgi:hypothetical protein